MSVEEGFVFFSEFATSDIGNQLSCSRAFYLPCRRDGLENRMSGFQQKSPNKFSQKEFHSISTSNRMVLSAINDKFGEW